LKPQRTVAWAAVCLAGRIAVVIAIDDRAGGFAADQAADELRPADRARGEGVHDRAEAQPDQPADRIGARAAAADRAGGIGVDDRAAILAREAAGRVRAIVDDVAGGEGIDEVGGVEADQSAGGVGIDPARHRRAGEGIDDGAVILADQRADEETIAGDRAADQADVADGAG
jgi:hypothetical protein